MNIALSQTKYQYYSCARATTDLLEIPSHLIELLVSDYAFVRRFATTDGKTPISRDVFDKMIFCEEIFRLINLEETLYFTELDLAINSFQKEDTIDEETLL